MPRSIHKPRMYGLFERQDGKWVRLYPEMAYRKDVAVKLFQNALLAGIFGDAEGVLGERRLRPIKEG